MDSWPRATAILVLVALLGVAIGLLLSSATPMCADDVTGKRVCVVPQAQGPNRLEHEP